VSVIQILFGQLRVLDSLKNVLANNSNVAFDIHLSLSSLNHAREDFGCSVVLAEILFGLF
jgi:hypothetical protein